jgi:hypothetical protein
MSRVGRSPQASVSTRRGPDNLNNRQTLTNELLEHRHLVLVTAR